jgi:signal transduction histidine kinase
VKNFKFGIATKVFVAISFIVILFSGLLFTSFVRTRNLYENIERLNQVAVPLSLKISDLQANIRNAQGVLSKSDPFVLKRTVQVTEFVFSFPRRIQGNYREAENLFNQLEESRFHVAGTRAQFREIRPAIERFNNRFRRLSEVITSENPGPDRSTQTPRDLRAKLIETGNKVTRQLELISQDVQQFSDQTLARANQQYRYNLYGFGALTAIAIALSVLVLISILRSLKPLETLTEATRRVGEGEYPEVELQSSSWVGTDELQALSREFDRMVDQLQARDEQISEQHSQILKSQRLATIGEMTSLITHEIRNPLSSISLNTDMLEDELSERTDAEALELLGAIQAEIDRLKTITEEYLDYAKLPTPSKEPVDLRTVVEDVVDFYSEQWRQSDIEIQTNIPEDSWPEIEIDEDQIRRAFLNIAQNAVEALEASDEPRILTITVSREESEQVIAVEDTGPGIPDEIRDNLFEAFTTGKSSGSGLGLAMARQIAVDHGGRIEVETSSKGSRFEIYLTE